MKSLFSRSAIIATALLVSSLTFSTQPLAAKTHFFPTQQQIKNPKLDGGIAHDHAGAIGASSGRMSDEMHGRSSQSEMFAAPPTVFVATAYSLRGRTASGKLVAKGLIAADPRVLPLGSRVRIEAAFFSGDYLVADTGGAVRGKRIDIWTPSTREAFRFGRRPVKLTVLSYGPKRAKKAKR
jgi:3D (Asp-Asp-Asp) domain-containing protein